jgi:hypothetical protein
VFSDLGHVARRCSRARLELGSRDDEQFRNARFRPSRLAPRDDLALVPANARRVEISAGAPPHQKFRPPCPDRVAVRLRRHADGLILSRAGASVVPGQALHVITVTVHSIPQRYDAVVECTVTVVLGARPDVGVPVSSEIRRTSRGASCQLLTPYRTSPSMYMSRASLTIVHQD